MPDSALPPHDPAPTSSQDSSPGGDRPAAAVPAPAGGGPPGALPAPLRDRLERSLRLECLGRLAGGVAHEFNNLLVGILGNAELALLDLDEGAPLRPLLKEIETAGRRAAALTGEMLALAGRGQSGARPLDLSELVRGTAGLLRVAAHRQAVLDCELASGMPPVRADPAQLLEALMHLVLNAVEATAAAGRGRVVVRTRTEGGGSGRKAILEVEDEGAGLPEPLADRIYEPFVSSRPGRLGLGLPAAARIAAACGGTIGHARAPRGGMVFRLTLPAAAS